MGRKTQANTHHRTNNTLNTLIDNLLKISTTPHVTQPSKALQVHRELHAILEEIIRTTPSKKVAVNQTREEVVNCFTDWVKCNGAIFEGACIDSFTGYELGIRAKMDIVKDSLVIAVPRNLMMTIESAMKSPLGVLIEKDQILKNMPNVALAMFLLVEKFKGDSFWKPYIDLLPKSYTTVLYFNVEEMKELQGSPTLESALKQVKSIARQFAYFYKLVGTSDDPASRILKGKFTYEEYR